MKSKLKMVSYSYNVNEAKKTVTAVVKTKSCAGCYGKYHTTVGVAKCDDKDEFDVEIGKRIAKAKAEKEAYVQHKNYLYNHLKMLKYITDDLSKSYERTQYYIQHQKEYINSFKK